MYRELPVSEAYHIQTGGPLIMIASVSKDGVPDVMTAAWNAPHHDRLRLEGRSP